jgi:molecular chaperone DnaK (HSP70)
MTGPQQPPPSEAPHPTDPIVGIDLGTTYSLVAHAAPGLPTRVLPGLDGRLALPSVVRFIESAPPIVGWPARDNARRHPASTIASIKRLMGRGLADAAADLAYLPYEVIEGADQGRTARVRFPWGQVVSPQEVSSLILRELREAASVALGTPVRRAVVTVPAYFDDAQRQATRDAGRLAGLDIVRIVNEPTAAALAYGLGLRARPNHAKPRHIIVYDFGGGTFDVSLLRITPPQPPNDPAPGTVPNPATPPAAEFFEVLATAGDTHLGGDDIDRLIVDHLWSDLHASTPAPAPSPEALTALTAAAERAKIQLSTADSATISLTLPDGPAPAALQRTITRAELEAWIAPAVDRTIDCLRRVLRDARRKLDGAPLDAAVMVGGSTRIPLVRRRVAEALGIEPYTALDPDQVVALGAAEQARLLAHQSPADALLLDVIPLSLGIETVGGAVAKLIVRNSTVPAHASELFSTSVDGQSSIKLSVYQGEREMAADCRLLGLFHLAGIPPMPAGIPQVQVDFHVDANGVLSVSALERRSNTRAAIQIVPNHGLTRAEVDTIERDSLRFAREDMARHRVADLIANSRLDVSMIRRQLDRHGRSLAPAEHAALIAALAQVESLLASAEASWQSVNADQFQQAKEAMDRASMRLHELAITAVLQARAQS